MCTQNLTTCQMVQNTCSRHWVSRTPISDGQIKTQKMLPHLSGSRLAETAWTSALGPCVPWTQRALQVIFFVKKTPVIWGIWGIELH